MKKLTRKLLLSVFSLGLAVVTLSTTTFAWYTSNTEVTASDVNAEALGEADGSLEIQTKSMTTWKPTVTFNETDLADYEVLGKLEPLQNVGGTLSPREGGSTGAYIQFKIKVRKSMKDGGAPTPVYLKNLTITNETGTLPQKNILSLKGGLLNTENTIGALSETYTIDIRRALSFSVTSPAVGTGGEAVEHQNYSLGSYISTAYGDSFGANTNAHKYWVDVMREALNLNADYEKEVAKVAAGAATEGTAIKVCVLPSEAPNADAPNGTPVEVTFTFWLDGWDIACFDACQGQSIKIGFALTTDVSICDITQGTSSAAINVAYPVA